MSDSTDYPFTLAYVAGDEDQGPSREYEPAILPARWKKVPMHGGTGFVYPDGLKVICTIAREKDGKDWLHVSASRADRLPSWEDMRNIKDIFVGCEKKALIILPPRKEYVNIHPYVLHMWSCLGEDPLPDFRRSGVI